MTTPTDTTDSDSPFVFLALCALLVLSPMVAVGVLGACWEPGGAAFFFIGFAIVAISIYPVVALFVAEPWRLIVAIAAGLVGSGTFVCAVAAYYQSQNFVWDLKFFWAVGEFFLLGLLPTAFAAGTIILAGYSILEIPVVSVFVSDVPSDGFLWRISERLRRKAIERRSEELVKEERRIQGETALIRARTEAQLTGAKAKYLNSLTEAERATLQLRMEAMARADVSVARHVERLEAENAELRRDLARLLAR